MAIYSHNFYPISLDTTVVLLQLFLLVLLVLNRTTTTIILLDHDVVNICYFSGEARENSRGERPPPEADAGVAVPETTAGVQAER